MNIEDNTLKKTFELTIEKMHGKDISQDIDTVKGDEDIDILLETF